MSNTLSTPDTIELEISDYRTARTHLAENDPSFLRYLGQRRDKFVQHFGHDYDQFLDLTERALVISYVRMASRYGSWSNDLHHYHNETHVVEILSDRIDYLCEHAGPDVLPAKDWIMLTLFAAMHDLRQRQTPEPDAVVGANERASIHEAHRILEIAGFDRQQHEPVFEDIRMMIAGSTFNVQPKNNPNISPPEAASSCGAMAPILVRAMDRESPGWRDDECLKRRARLTLIASDLDTANVAEPFLRFTKSAVRLCKEIEYRCQRDLGVESAKPALGFLTNGQEGYFFKLHQFDSRLGQSILGPLKDQNAPLLTQLCTHMRDTFGEEPSEGVTGEAIIDEFMHKAFEISGRAAKTSPAHHSSD